MLCFEKGLIIMKVFDATVVLTTLDNGAMISQVFTHDTEDAVIVQCIINTIRSHFVPSFNNAELAREILDEGYYECPKGTINILSSI